VLGAGTWRATKAHVCEQTSRKAAASCKAGTDLGGVQAVLVLAAHAQVRRRAPQQRHRHGIAVHFGQPPVQAARVSADEQFFPHKS
jgi:hypothetical protein